MRERARFDQLRHRRLGGGVVDGPRPPVHEHEKDQEREIDATARDQQCQCHEHEGASEVGHSHQPAPLESVRERACWQRQHEPRERIGCRDRRHRERMRIHEQSEEGNRSVSQAVAEARYREGCPEVVESSPQRSADAGCSLRHSLRSLAPREAHVFIIARIWHPRCDHRAPTRLSAVPVGQRPRRCLLRRALRGERQATIPYR